MKRTVETLLCDLPAKEGIPAFFRPVGKGTGRVSARLAGLGRSRQVNLGDKKGCIPSLAAWGNKFMLRSKALNKNVHAKIKLY